MRVPLSTIVLFLVLCAFASVATAQERVVRPVPTVRPSPALTERAVTVKADAVAPPASHGLSAGDTSFRPLRLEPRRPFVQGRGHLAVNDAVSFDPSANEIGMRTARSMVGQPDLVELFLNLPAGRFVVDCQLTLDRDMSFRSVGAEIQLLSGDRNLALVLDVTEAGWTRFWFFAPAPKTGGGAYTFRGCDVFEHGGS